MSAVATIWNHAFLKGIHEESYAQAYSDAYSEGYAEGFAEGLMLGKIEVVTSFLTSKFGPLPAWATKRLTTATTTIQLDRWITKLPTATTLEGVIGRRRA